MQYALENKQQSYKAYGMNTIISDVATVSSMVEKIIEMHCAK